MARNAFDQACRYLAKLDPIGFLTWLLGGLWGIRFQRWLDTRTVPFPGEPDRICDTVAGLVETAGPQAWALPIEFQVRPQRRMFGRLLEYLGRMWLELRPAGGGRRYHVGAAVVNLTGVGHTAQHMNLARTGIETALRPVERNLADEDTAATLDAIAGERVARCILPWIPLMRGGNDPRIIARWKQVAGSEPNDSRRADYAGLVLVFAELTKTRARWKAALEGWNMKQSMQVLEWQAEAKAETTAKLLLRLLERRFGEPPKKLQAAIVANTDAADLERWFDAAMNATTLPAFRRAIAN